MSAAGGQRRRRPRHAAARPASGPLDLDAYAGILAARFGALGVAVGAEPGEFLTNDSGVLLAEVVSVEERLGTTFVGLDAGWNIMNDPYIYGRTAGGRRRRPRRRSARPAR